MNIVIQTPGASIKIQNGNFLMQINDNTHTFHPDKIKSITISKGAIISSDAITTAIENEIDIIFVDNLGNPIGRIWSHKYGSISTIRIKQTEFVFSTAASQFIIQTLANKIDGNIAILLYLKNLLLNTKTSSSEPSPHSTTTKIKSTTHPPHHIRNSTHTPRMGRTRRQKILRNHRQNTTPSLQLHQTRRTTRHRPHQRHTQLPLRNTLL